MSSVRYKASQIRLRSVSVALSVLVPFAIGSPCRLSAQDPAASAELYSVRRMADGKQWTTLNLNVNIVPSWCYNDSEANCLRYGRLYTWESARRACESLRDGWRLPTEDEWRQLAKHYGGINDDSEDRGKAAYRTLSSGGNARFNVLLGGGRSGDGQYARLQAHGFFWTASEMCGWRVLLQFWSGLARTLSSERWGEGQCLFCSVRQKLTKTARGHNGS